VVHEEMRAGVYGVATIASLAPWAGLFGTILGIVNSFHGISGDRASGMAAAFEGLSESLWPTAFGLAVGLMSLWFYRYLSGRLRTFNLEMENASLDLLNQLSRLPARFAIAPAIDGPMFGEVSPAELKRDDNFERRCRFLAGSALVLAWRAQVVLAQELLPWVHLPLMFVVSCLVAYPLWVKLLHRRPGGLMALASVICLGWSVAELALGKHLP
jgi:hypothetical protein